MPLQAHELAEEGDMVILEENHKKVAASNFDISAIIAEEEDFCEAHLQQTIPCQKLKGYFKNLIFQPTYLRRPKVKTISRSPIKHRTLTYFVRGSMTVWLTSSLSPMETTKFCLFVCS